MSLKSILKFVIKSIWEAWFFGLVMCWAFTFGGLLLLPQVGLALYAGNYWIAAALFIYIVAIWIWIFTGLWTPRKGPGLR